MSKTDVQISIGADTSPLAKAFARAKDIVSSSAKDMQGNMPKVLGSVKALSGALGGAAAAAGLVPGLGVAAIGVAGLVAGVNAVREHYADLAQRAKDLMDHHEKIRQFMTDIANVGRDELTIEKEKTEELKKQRAALNESMKGVKVNVSQEGVMTDEIVYRKMNTEESKKLYAINEAIAESVLKQKSIEQSRAEEKKKTTEAEDKASSTKNDQLDEQISKLKEDAKISAMTSEQKIKFYEKEKSAIESLGVLSKANELEILNLSKKISDEESKAAAQREADFNKEHAQEEELARLQSDRAKARMTDQEKFIALVKAGRAAQKAVNADPNDMGAKIKLEGLRGEYETMTRGKTGKEAKPKAESTMKNGVLVSAEDRARSEAATAQAKKYDDEARSKAIGAEPKAGAGAKDKGAEALTTMSESMVSVDEQLKDLLGKFN